MSHLQTEVTNLNELVLRPRNILVSTLEFTQTSSVCSHGLRSIIQAMLDPILSFFLLLINASSLGILLLFYNRMWSIFSQLFHPSHQLTDLKKGYLPF